MERDSEKDIEPIATKGTGQSDENIQILNSFSEEEKRKITRRVDFRLVSVVGFLYCVSLIDRVNLSNASVAGMTVDLVLTGDRYSIISLVFFITYILFEPISTILVRKIGPRFHLSAITLLWGSCMIGMGFVSSWEQMTGLRLILGVLEAGFFPSSVYLLSTWYTRYEVGKRYSWFYLVGVVAAAFGGILAYGLMQMAGVAGMNGWRWIFVWEGVLTCILSVIGFLLLVDFPDSNRHTIAFLTERERSYVIAKVNVDRGDAKVLPFSWSNYLPAGKDIKIWAYGLIFFNTTTITYALGYFLPIILKDSLKFDVAKAQCLVAPPYVFAGIVMLGTGWVGDKYKVRGPIIIFNMIIALIGLPIFGWHSDAAVRYFGIFLTTAGANSNVPAVLSYQANNIRGQWKRAFGSAILVGFGAVGGIAGSLVFRSQDSPGYRPGLYACIACCLLNIIVVSLLTVYFYVENGKADRGEKELEVSEEDSQGGFRYTY